MYVYKFNVLSNISVHYWNKLRALFVKFIWNGGKPKIGYDILTGIKNEGGAGLVDIIKKDASLKIAWVWKLMAPEYASLKTLAYTLMGNEMGDDIWRVQLVP